MLQLSHESYNGYTHNDGQREVTVMARREKDAKNKAIACVRPYEGRIISY